jgi:hypothetical protein
MVTVRKPARDPGDNEVLLDRTPLPPEESGSISRRRIAAALPEHVKPVSMKRATWKNVNVLKAWPQADPL